MLIMSYFANALRAVFFAENYPDKPEMSTFKPFVKEDILIGKVMKNYQEPWLSGIDLLPMDKSDF
jgi:hypothetical protein